MTSPTFPDAGVSSEPAARVPGRAVSRNLQQIILVISLLSAGNVGVEHAASLSGDYAAIHSSPSHSNDPADLVTVLKSTHTLPGDKRLMGRTFRKPGATTVSPYLDHLLCARQPPPSGSLKPVTFVWLTAAVL